MSMNILQYSINGEFIKEWEDIWQIDEELDLNPKQIRACCINRANTYCGYMWKYKTTQQIPLFIEPINSSSDKYTILCYDLFGDFITGFRTYKEAATELKLRKTDIKLCCEGKKSRVGSYMFVKTDDLRDLALKIAPFKGKILTSEEKVAQYTKYGELVKIWDSKQEAAIALNIKNPLDESLNDMNNAIMVNNFIWKYIPKNTEPQKIIQTQYFPIIQYDKFGNFVKAWYCDWKEIVEIYGTKPKYSLDVHPIVQAWNCYWKKADISHEKSYKRIKISKQTMPKYSQLVYIQYDTDKKEVNRWKNLNDIRKEFPQMTKKLLDKACSDKRREYFGYVWRRRKRLKNKTD